MSVGVARAMAKAIVAKQLVDELIDEHDAARRSGIARNRQQVREAWGAIVIRHLDAYDQRV